MGGRIPGAPAKPRNPLAEPGLTLEISAHLPPRGRLQRAEDRSKFSVGQAGGHFRRANFEPGGFFK